MIDHARRVAVDELIFLPALGATRAIDGWTMTNCTLQGPAVVHIDGCEMDRCSIDLLGAPVESVFIEVARDRSVVGVIAMRRSRLVACSLRNLGYIGPQEQLDAMRVAFMGLS